MPYAMTNALELSVFRVISVDYWQCFVRSEDCLPVMAFGFASVRWRPPIDPTATLPPDGSMRIPLLSFLSRYPYTRAAFCARVAPKFCVLKFLRTFRTHNSRTLFWNELA